MSLDPLIERLERIHKLSHEKISPITEKEVLRGRTANLIKRTALAVYGDEAITLFDGDVRAVGFHKDHRLVLRHAPVLRFPEDGLRPGETNPYVSGVFVRRLDEHALAHYDLFSDQWCVHGPDYGHPEPAKAITEVCMHNANPVSHSIVELIPNRTLRIEHHDDDSRTEYLFPLNGSAPTKNLLGPGKYKNVLSIVFFTPEDHPAAIDIAKRVVDRTCDLLDRVIGEAEHEQPLMRVDGLGCHGTRVVLTSQAYEVRKGSIGYRLHRLSTHVPRLDLGRLNIHVGNDLSTIPLRIDDNGAFTLADEDRALLDAAGTVYQLAGEQERDLVKVTLGVMAPADYELHQQDMRVTQMRGALTDLLARMRTYRGSDDNQTPDRGGLRP